MENFNDFITLREIRNSSLPDDVKSLLEVSFKEYRANFELWKEETIDDPITAMDFFAQGMTLTFGQEIECRRTAPIHPLLPQIKRLTYVYENAIKYFRSNRTA